MINLQIAFIVQMLFCFVQYIQLVKKKNNINQYQLGKDIIKNSKTEVILVNNEVEIEKFLKKNLANNEIVIGMGAGSISMWMKKISVNYKKYVAKNKNNKILDLKKNCWIGTGGIANNTFFPEDEKDLHNYLKNKK